MESSLKPNDVRESIRLVCTACGGMLTEHPGRGLTCDSCAHEYPIVAGIPDLRPPLARFDVAADHEIAERLVGMKDTSFEDLLRRYWQLHAPEIPPVLVDRFVRGDLIGESRSATVAEQIERLTGVGLSSCRAVLEVGAGTAALATELAGKAGAVAVTDVSLAWCVLAQRRLRDAGRTNVMVLACSGERLPFQAETFDLVVAADVIEHVPDPGRFIEAAYAVLAPGGVFWLSTPNRFSLTPEPHVRLWGVGLLPRRLALRYVRRFRGVDYDDTRTVGVGRLRRLLDSVGGTVVVAPPPIPAPVRGGYGRAGRLLIDMYNALRRIAAARVVFLRIGPLFHGVVHKPAVAEPRRPSDPSNSGLRAARG